MKTHGSNECQTVGVIRLTGEPYYREDVRTRDKQGHKAPSMLRRRFQSNLSHSVKGKLILIVCVRISWLHEVIADPFNKGGTKAAH